MSVGCVYSNQCVQGMDVTGLAGGPRPAVTGGLLGHLSAVLYCGFTVLPVVRGHAP